MFDNEFLEFQKKSILQKKTNSAANDSKKQLNITLSSNKNQGKADIPDKLSINVKEKEISSIIDTGIKQCPQSIISDKKIIKAQDEFPSVAEVDNIMREKKTVSTKENPEQLLADNYNTDKKAAAQKSAEIPEKKIIRSQDEFPSVAEVDDLMREKYKLPVEPKADSIPVEKQFQMPGVLLEKSIGINPFGSKISSSSDKVKDFQKISSSIHSDSHNIERKKHSAKQNEHIKYLFFAVIAVIAGLTLAIILNRTNTTSDIFYNAVSFQKNKDFKSAIHNYYKYYEKSAGPREKIKALYYIGLCYYSDKQYNQALKIFLKITSLESTPFYSGVSLYWIGVIYKTQGIFNKSIEYFNQLIVKYPDNPMIVESYKNILEIKIKMSDWNNVIDICKTLLSFKDANIDGDIYYFLALSYEQLRFQEAADKYYRILVENTNYDQQYVKLARQKLYNRLASLKNNGDTEIPLKEAKSEY